MKNHFIELSFVKNLTYFTLMAFLSVSPFMASHESDTTTHNQMNKNLGVLPDELIEKLLESSNYQDLANFRSTSKEESIHIKVVF
jgi:hypothetical protein